jgi:hypothetical protein
MKGGEMVIEMGKKPSASFGVSRTDRPYSVK